MPYLIPEESILEALIIAANSGIDVRIMVPCMSDHPFVYRATEYYAKYLVVHGVKVYKYNDGFIHAKTMVSGSNISSVGSANQDFRSYTLNFEVNSFNYNPALTQELKKIFEKDLDKCTLLTNDYFAQQSSWLKFKQYFSRLLSPIFNEKPSIGLSDRGFTLYFKNAVLFLYLFFISYIAMITIKK